MNTSSFMDKQIMDLSSSSSAGGGGAGKEFIDFGKDDKKDEILAGYDFRPLRSHHLDGAEGSRTWNSLDSKSKLASAFKTYGSVDALEPAKVSSGKEVPDAAILSEIERTMKKHADELLHALEGVSARLTQLESKTRHLEHSVDDLKVSVGNNYGSTDGKMRQIENMLREVQTGVQILTDKHDSVVAHLESVQIQAPKAMEQAAAPVQQSAAAPQQPYQQLHPPPALPPAALTLPSPNAPPPPPPPTQLQNFSPQVQFANQFPQSQIPIAAQQDPYFPSPSHAKDSPNPQYQIPQTQLPQAPPSSAPHQPYPPAPHPHPHPQYIQGPQPSQQHPSLPPVNPSPPQNQPPTGHHPEETPYGPSQNYPPNTYQPPSYPPNSSAPPSQQFYGSPSNMYEPPSGRPGSGYSNEPPSSRAGSGYSSGYGGPAGPTEPFPYSGSPRYGGGSTMKPQQFSSSGTSQGGGNGYPQLPTARILPQALPTATPVSGGSGSSGTGNRVPVDDVIDKVTIMGFSRDQVRSTVRRLTENGQSVDLNVVLDKLMNGS